MSFPEDGIVIIKGADTDRLDAEGREEIIEAVDKFFEKAESGPNHSGKAVVKSAANGIDSLSAIPSELIEPAPGSELPSVCGSRGEEPAPIKNPNRPVPA